MFIVLVGHTFALGTETFIPRSQWDTKQLVSLNYYMMPLRWASLNGMLVYYRIPPELCLGFHYHLLVSICITPARREARFAGM